MVSRRATPANKIDNAIKKNMVSNDKIKKDELLIEIMIVP